MNNDRIGEVYDRTWGSPEFQERSRARIHWLCRHAEGRRILDVGCSQGVASILLGREGKTVCGVDREAVAVEVAEERLAREESSVRERVSFVHSDVTEIDPPDVPFDSALLGEVIEHQIDPGAVLEAAARLVRPGGALVFSTPYGLLPYHDHKEPIYLEMLVEMLSDTLQLERLELLDRYLCGVIRVLGPGQTRVEEAPYGAMLELAEQRLRRQDAEIGRLGGRHTQLRDELEAARATIDELRAAAAERGTAATEQLHQARLDARTHRMHRERAETERDALQRSLDAREADLRELRKLAHDHEQGAAVARAELSVLAERLAEHERITSRLREREQQLARLIDERDALAAQLEDVKRAAADGATRESALRKSLNEAEEDAIRLRVECDKLAGMLETEDQRLATAEQRVRDLAAELDRESATAATATAQVEQLRAARPSRSAGP